MDNGVTGSGSTRIPANSARPSITRRQRITGAAVQTIRDERATPPLRSRMVRTSELTKTRAIRSSPYLGRPRTRTGRTAAAAMRLTPRRPTPST
jgi:hypothetical protein